MELVQHMDYPCNPFHAAPDPSAAIRVQINLFYFFQIIPAVQILIDFIPELLISFPRIHTAKVMRVYQPVALTFWCLFFNPFVNIDQFCKQAVILLTVFIFHQISLFLTKLQ